LPPSPKKKSGCRSKRAPAPAANRRDVAHFLRTLAITTPAALRQADHKAVIAWERCMRESEQAAPSTIRRRLAALSSLRRAEIAALKVGDLHQNRGYDSLRVVRKGGRRDALAINLQTAAPATRLSGQ
jgi:hypothetical protein